MRSDFETTDNRLTGISIRLKPGFDGAGIMYTVQLATMRTQTCRADVWPAPFAVSIACFAQSAPTPQAITAPSSPSNPDFAPAQALLQQGKYDEAIAQLQAMATKNPGLKGLSHELGTAYYKKGDYIKAIESFKQALAEDPDNKEAVQLLGLSYYLSGRPGRSHPPAGKGPGLVSAGQRGCRLHSGIVLHPVQKLPSGTQGLCTDVCAVPSDSAASYLFTARMLLRQEFDPIAEEYAQKAIALDPKLPLAHFFLGELHLYKSRIPEAISDFQQELALNPGHAPTYYKLADASAHPEIRRCRAAAATLHLAGFNFNRTLHFNGQSAAEKRRDSNSW